MFSPRMRLLPVLISLAISTTACAKAPPARVQPAAAPEVTTIRMALWENAKPIFEPVIAAFQDKHTEYRVETVPITNWTQIEGMVRSGTVDLVPQTLTWDNMIRNGMRPVSIDPYVAKSHFDTAPFGPVFEGEVVDGSHYGLPLYGYPLVFAYNKRLVAEAGVTIPTGSWTWEEFRDTAVRLTRGKGDEKVWGFDWSPGTAPEYLVYLMALQRAPAGGLPDSRTFRDVLRFFEGLVTVDQSMVPRPADFDQQPAQPYCMTGKAALCLVPFAALSLPEFKDFAMAPFPMAPAGKPLILAAVGSYGIAGNAKDPDAAWALLSFMAGPEGSLQFARGGQVPVYSTEANRQAWADSPAAKPAGWEQVLRAPWYVPPKLVIDTYSPYGALIEGSRRILAKTQSVDDAVAFYEKMLKETR